MNVIPVHAEYYLWRTKNIAYLVLNVVFINDHTVPNINTEIMAIAMITQAITPESISSGCIDGPSG